MLIYKPEENTAVRLNIGVRGLGGMVWFKMNGEVLMNEF